MKCPNCNNDIAWNKINKIIGRWKSLECPKCHSLLNRRLDIQLFFIFILGGAGLLGIVLLIAPHIIAYLIMTLGINWGVTLGIGIVIILTIPWILIITIFDAKTVRLAPVEKRQGIKKIMGHKYIKKD
jgi:hypothetical protein